TRETASASSSRRGGTTLPDLRLTKRSMMRARARMEQASRGQIGQPAACMIENKRGPPPGHYCWKSARFAPRVQRIIATFLPVGIAAVRVGRIDVAVGRHSQKLWITLLRKAPPQPPGPHQCSSLTER